MRPNPTITEQAPPREDSDQRPSVRSRESPETPATSPLSQRAPIIWLAVGAVLFLVLFAPTFLRLVQLWLKDANYSHGVLIPLISGLLAWNYFKRTGWPVQGELGLGTLYLLAGSFVHLAALVIAWPPLDFLALCLVLRGLAVSAGGRDWARGLIFPTLFLVFMFPLPVTWTGYAALWLQDCVSRLSTGILELFMLCYRRGNAIFLPGLPNPLIVAAECSGLRQIVAFVALGVLLGHWSERPALFRVLLVLVAIPVAILANVVRVLLMALGAHLFGTGWLSGPLHDAPALFSLPFGLLLYLLAAWGLSRLWQPRPSDPPVSEYRPEPTSAPPAGMPRRLVIACCCLGLGVLAQIGLLLHLRGTAEGAYTTLENKLADLPLRLTSAQNQAPLARAWQGVDRPGLEQLRQRISFADDLISRVYRPEPGGPLVNLYVVYSSIGEDRKHHPEICIREVAGAPEDLGARKIIYLDAEEKRAVQRFRFRTGTVQHTTVYYWHYTFPPIAREGQTVVQSLHQRLSQSAPSVTVQVSTAASPEELEVIEKSFLGSVDEALQANHLPPGTGIGCQRLPVAVIRE